MANTSVVFDVKINPSVNMEELRETIRKEIKEEMTKQIQGNSSKQVDQPPTEKVTGSRDNSKKEQPVIEKITDSEDNSEEEQPPTEKVTGSRKNIKKRKGKKSSWLNDIGEKDEDWEENPYEEDATLPSSNMMDSESNQPFTSDVGERRSGGIFGGVVERKDPVGFTRAKQIRGGVESQRDNRSQSPIVPERWIEQQKRMEDLYERMTNRRISGFTGLLTDGQNIGDMIFGDGGDKKLKEMTSDLGNKLFGKGGDVKVQDSVEKYMTKNTQRLGVGASALANPKNMGPQFLQLLAGFGPYGMAATAAIGAIIIAPEMIAQIIKILGQKGLPFNKDWVRLIENEVNGMMNIEDKKKRFLGQDAYIITQVDDYRPSDGSPVFNSLQNRDEVIISRIGLAEKAFGII